MSRGAFALPLALCAGAITLACVDIPTGADDVLSVQVNALPSPSVVAGDTLRDSLGRVSPLSITAFNYRNEVIDNPPARFRAFDARIRIDSLTGVLIGDSASASPSRVLATFAGLTSFLNIPVVLRPDTVIGVNDRDSLSYSLTDTAANVSSGSGVRVLHGLTTTDSAVASYRVTFEIVPASDTLLARLVNDNGARSSVDTTDSNGRASRRLKIDVNRITDPVDSVVVMASVRYRGQHVRGSPRRLLLRIKPK